jgi:cytochrome c oxidase accessory protein FixG
VLGFTGSRKWVYTQSIKGRWQRVHRWSSILLHAIFVVTPWITLNDHPALRIDLPARRVYVLGSVFTAGDGFLLVLLTVLLLFALFFFTSLFGRVWCGYVCPQTVFLEEWVRPIEKFIEGDRAARKALDAAPWTARKIGKKLAKWTAFAAVALFVSMTFMGYFAGAGELWTLRAGPVNYAIVGAFAAMWFTDFVWFREQFCNYLCPYARFQSALTDRYSLLVNYDAPRGEPRAKGKASGQAGHCVDCDKCVVVCPQGIDIRDGFQLECVQCARCIDACTTVMDKFQKPSLVHYSSMASDAGEGYRLVRARTLVYAGLLSAIAALFVGLVALHEPIEATVNRAPGTLFTVDEDGFVRNTFMVKVANNEATGGTEAIGVTIEGLEGAEVIVPPLALAAQEARTVPLVVRVPTDKAPRTAGFVVRIQKGEQELAVPATFKGPADGEVKG